MEALPQLALDLVCQYLAYSEPRRASLLAFASASRICRAAAWRELFSQVSINVDDAQLHQRLEQLECMLEKAKSRTCVRVLKLGVSTAYQTGREDGEAEDAFGSLMRLVPNFHPINPLRERKPRTKPRPEEWWQPLARFISSIHLKDFTWASTEQIPRCILSVLNEQIPSCRLHVHEFELQSLHQRETLQDIDETEYMLASSPCLYSIVASYSLYDTSGYANYNGEATLRLAAGLAPNLKHVCVWDNARMSSGEISPRRRDARLEWRGFHPQSGSEWCETPEIKGQLQSLAIDAIHTVSGSQLKSWENHTDFSVLRSLQFTRQIELDILQDLATLAEQDGLSCLRALDLPAVSWEEEELAEVAPTMTRLFLSLHPLVELGIVGVGVSNFEAILGRHGGNLQILRVEKFILSPHQVTQLRDSCLNIRKLSIEILRSAGDHVEVEIYRTLGSMRNLESLSLKLQCTDYRSGDGPDDPEVLMMPSDDEENEEAMAIAIRQVFINAAVDESLAQSIFRQVLAAHDSVKAGLPPRLDIIRLRVGGAPAVNDQRMSPDFEGILAWIGRSWICRRDPRDTHRSNLTIEEVNSDARLSEGKRLEDDMEELWGSEQYADVWKALWPETGAGWKREWKSIPLVVDADNFTGTETFLRR